MPGALMIGVDRLDYSKGITLRLEAYERFLAAHPEWHGKITYLQITPKSRSPRSRNMPRWRQAVNAHGRPHQWHLFRRLLVAGALCEPRL